MTSRAFIMECWSDGGAGPPAYVQNFLSVIDAKADAVRWFATMGRTVVLRCARSNGGTWATRGTMPDQWLRCEIRPVNLRRRAAP